MRSALVDGVDSDLLGLPEAAEVLGVHRATVNDMVTDGRLPARRDGVRWVVNKADLESFAANYVRPPNAPPRRVRGGLLESSRSVLDWLHELGEAAAIELAQVVDLHEGNVRKHLRILEVKGMVERLSDGSWVLTDRGRRARAIIE